MYRLIKMVGVWVLPIYYFAMFMKQEYPAEFQANYYYIYYTTTWWAVCLFVKVFKQLGHHISLVVSLALIPVIIGAVVCVFLYNGGHPFSLKCKVSMFIAISGLGSAIISVEDIAKMIALILYRGSFYDICGKDYKSKFNVMQLILILQSLQCAYGLSIFAQTKLKKKANFYTMIGKNDTAFLLIGCHIIFILTSMIDFMLISYAMWSVIAIDVVVLIIHMTLLSNEIYEACFWLSLINTVAVVQLANNALMPII